MAKLRDGRLGVNNFEEKYIQGVYAVTDDVPIDAFKLILMAAVYVSVQSISKCDHDGIL